LADDIKFEDYWYENLVLWTALTQDGRLQMAIKRASAAGGGYWLRTFDPLTLKNVDRCAAEHGASGATHLRGTA